MEYEQLQLRNQICFPIYAASRLITREYQPYLDALGITYPQYLVLLVLWETDIMPVNEISKKLILNTNTITPLLKRMEAQGLVSRTRFDKDERKVMVQLTEKGKAMKLEAETIPEQFANGLVSDLMTIDQVIDLRDNLNVLITVLMAKDQTE